MSVAIAAPKPYFTHGEWLKYLGFHTRAISSDSTFYYVPKDCRPRVRVPYLRRPLDRNDYKQEWVFPGR